MVKWKRNLTLLNFTLNILIDSHYLRFVKVKNV